MLLPSQTSTVVSLLSLVPFMAASGGGPGASRCPCGVQGGDDVTLLVTGPLSLNWLGPGSERIEAIL
ncbi:hypothetical protein PoMZ_03555 [Pyricularia oryzae]|uniref:Uncharacterized protein n=1 Tax=Pyricularia oryzae TaxID=318829 RepID=A0A4P7N810_PYROR|nr:hypothetical protein PoMZ_03555 [Pyricularia oryzae]